MKAIGRCIDWNSSKQNATLLFSVHPSHTTLSQSASHIIPCARWSRSSWATDLPPRMDDALFWHEYEARVRNLEKLDAAVDKMVENMEAAHIENISQEKARSRMGQNMNLLSRAMRMEERLLRLGTRELCPFCRER